MSTTTESTPKWFEQLEKLQAILNEGHATASEIIGQEPKEATDDSRKSSCHIERLSYELAQALRSAENLVSRLRKINAAF